jgi:hypothetical protein
MMSSYAQALPNSLQVMEAFCVPAGVLTQLTLLERLSLDSMISSEAQHTCGLSALQRLTWLHLNYAVDADLRAIEVCTGLCTLCLSRASLLQLPLHAAWL